MYFEEKVKLFFVYILKQFNICFILILICLKPYEVTWSFKTTNIVFSKILFYLFFFICLFKI